MRHALAHRSLGGLGLLVAATAACLDLGPVLGTPHEEGNPRVWLDLDTKEREGHRHLMVVGERAGVFVHRTDVDDVSLGVSSPGVITILPRADGGAEVVAEKAGSTELVASAGELSYRERIDVVDTPLPVSYMRVGLTSNWRHLKATYDTRQSLASLNLHVGGSAALDVYVRRGEAWVHEIPYELTSSDPSVVGVSGTCRPHEYDQSCSEPSAWGWVLGARAGTAVVTITIRNLTATFLVKVG